MQIYADVLGMEIKTTACTQTAALGAAIFAAAADSHRSGHRDVFSAIRTMGAKATVSYKPVIENTRKYNDIYRQFMTLHDFFGITCNATMHFLGDHRK